MSEPQWSQMKQTHILYHTQGCHLCELAAALLAEADVVFEPMDICDDDILAARYGVSIPVVKAIESGVELNWPFDLIELKTFVGA
jgi:glutaredoxin